MKFEYTKKYEPEEEDEEEYYDSDGSDRISNLIKMIVFSAWSIAGIVCLIVYRKYLFGNFLYYVEIDPNVIKTLTSDVNSALLFGAKHLALFACCLGVVLLPISVIATINFVGDKDVSFFSSYGWANLYSLLMIAGFIVLTIFMFRTFDNWKSLDFSYKLIKICYSMMFFVALVYACFGIASRLSFGSIFFFLLAAFLTCFLPPLGLYLSTKQGIFIDMLGMILMYAGPVLGIFSSLLSFSRGVHRV